MTDYERSTLQAWVAAGSTEQRYVLRASIVLAADQRKSTREIAAELRVREATVSKWRTRFAADGIGGLQDAPRPGQPRRYTQATEKRLLQKLDEAPPKGYGTWDGRLLAEALGDVSETYVWRTLRRYGIQLQRRRSWRISTDPEFAQKAADIVGLYLDPPEDAVVISADERPSIQALERAQGYLRLPNGRAITGYSHQYQRHGTTILFAALETATGLVTAGHYQRRRRREFLHFMNELVRQYQPDTRIHVILDNLNTHKPKHDRWLRRHPNVSFRFKPTGASWLNQTEAWFSILSRRALRGQSFTWARQLRRAIDAFMSAHNKRAAPFEWKKQVVYGGAPKQTYAKSCK